MTIDALIPDPPHPDEQPIRLFAGVILDTPADVEDEIRVRLNIDRDQYVGPCRWAPRNGHLPEQGDHCLVAFDDEDRASVVLWGPADAVAEAITGGGGGEVTQAELDAETAAREAADTDLAGDIAAEAGARAAADTNEATIRAAADTALDGRLDTIETDLPAHTADIALDGGPHGFPALTVDGMAWVRQGGALVAVDIATQAELDAHLNDTVDAHDASAVSFSPTGSIASTDVQAAIAEVASEAGGGSAHTIKDEGTPLAARAGLNFIGAGVAAADDAGGNETEITLDADLNAIAALTSAADKLPYATGAGAWAMADFSAAARSLLDDTTVAAMRTTLDVPSNAEAILDAIADAKGDLIAATAADAVARLAVGSADQVLTPDAAQSTGLKWARPRAVGAFTANRSTAVSYTTGSTVVFNNEEYDLDSWYDPTTGKYTPQVAGYYEFHGLLMTSAAQLPDQNLLVCRLAKNGSAIKELGRIKPSGTGSADGAGGSSPPVLANGTTDFFTILIVHNKGSAASLDVGAVGVYNYFGGRFVGTA